jgi:ApaG protein
MADAIIVRARAMTSRRAANDAPYEEITRDIRVTVRPIYLPDQSEPDQGHYVWAYQVRIENQGGQEVQLLNRYWRIVDSLGRVQEVRGAGVVGEQPILKPGEAFEYTSGTPLSTPSGIMGGTYEMEAEGVGRFDIKIPTFSLDSPDHKAKVH